MKAKIIYRYPTEQDIIDLAANMRKNDIEELCSVTDLSPLAAVKESIKLSDPEYLFAASIDGQLLCIGGAAPKDEYAIPWLLATQAMHAYSKTLTREVKRCLPMMLQRWPILTNVIPVNSQQNIKWLKAVGFHLMEKYALEKSEVIRFEMRVDHV